jgi:hypothetical protein
MATTRPPRPALTLAALLVPAVVACAVGPAVFHNPTARAAADAGETEAVPRMMGAVSCAAAACHNATTPRGFKGSEYGIWLDRDKHARAFEVLLNERSQRIERNLGRLSDTRRADNDTLCLNCHVRPKLKDVASPDVELADLAREGVGCESCHGNAERWRTEHYLAGWREKSDAEKERLGMVPTKDLARRARMCAGCHVGDRDRDVNHDLIAAGHPRLNFEFAGYLAVMPKHWRMADEKARHRDFEVRAWVLGQVTCARMALELLAARAGPTPGLGGKPRPWPELAEYNCFACHHDLQGKSWRQTRDLAAHPDSNTLGRPCWNTWYFSMPFEQAVATLPPARDRASVPAGLESLRREMSDRSPDHEKVRVLASRLAEQLAGLEGRPAEERYDDAARLGNLLRRIAADRGRRAESTWDEAAQMFLALGALYLAERELGSPAPSPEVRQDLETMRRALEFPRVPVKYDSPDEEAYKGDVERFREATRDIQQRLSR